MLARGGGGGGGRFCFMYKRKTARIETPTRPLDDSLTQHMKQIYEVEEKPSTSSLNVSAQKPAGRKGWGRVNKVVDCVQN
jgi:hypothetical protein